MIPEEQDLRTADSGAPPPEPATGPPVATGAASPETGPAIPEDALILISTRNLVLFPGTVLPITLGRQRSIAAAQTAIRLNRPVGLVLQREAATEDPIALDLHRVGTEANLLRYVTSPDGSHHVICQGERRLERISEFLAYRLEVLRLSRQISDRTKETIDDRQREFLLREQLKTIQKELGEGEDAKSQEIAELREKIEQAKMPEEVEAHAKKELSRLERMPEAAGEYSMARTYLEWLIELPWSVESAGA